MGGSPPNPPLLLRDLKNYLRDPPATTHERKTQETKGKEFSDKRIALSEHGPAAVCEGNLDDALKMTPLRARIK